LLYIYCKTLEIRVPASWNKRLAFWFISKPFLTGFLIYAPMQAMIGYITYQRLRIIEENGRRERTNQLHAVQQNFEQIFRNAATATLTMALTIDDQGKPHHFNEVGRRVIRSNPDIDAVELVPNGVIRDMYPLRGNENVIGYDVLDSPQNRKEAMTSIRTHTLYFAGPLKLQQGGTGVVGRLPVYIDRKFWGFSGVVIRMDKFEKAAAVHDGARAKYYFRLSHTDPMTGKIQWFFPGTSYPADLRESVAFPDTDWKLYAVTRQDGIVGYPLLGVALLASVLAFLVGLMLVLILRRPASLQLQVMKQARKLLNSEIKYKAIFDRATLGIAHLDIHDARFIEVNPHLCRMLGREPENIKDAVLFDLASPESADDLRRAVNTLTEGQTQASLEARYPHSSGNPVWVSQTLSPLWGLGEKPSAFIAIFQDITFKKEAEARLRESETRFKSLFENSPVALWEEDFSQVKKCLSKYPELHCSNARQWLSGRHDVVRECASQVRITDVNLACVDLHAPRSREEVMASDLGPLLDEGSFSSFIEQLEAVVCGKTFVSQDTRFTDATGERHIHLQWNVVPGYESTLQRVLVATEDVTREKVAQDLIRREKQRTEDLINSVEGIVWECDAKTFKLTFMSRQVENILGFTVEEWSADDYFWEHNIHPDDREVCVGILHTVAREKQQRDFEYRMYAKNGSIVWFRDFMNVTPDGKVMRGIMMDITAQKKSEQELHESLELINQQKKRLMNFSYIVSHNLRSHTANIQSIVNLLESADTEEEREEMLGMLKNVSGSLNETMVHLNELVNIQTNESLTVEPLPLHHYIESAQKAVSGQIEALEAVILNEVPEDVRVDFNAAYLESILLNLLSNALRYRHPDRKPLITAKWWNESGEKVLSISDNGIGIDLNRHGEKLFGLYKTFNGNSDARGIGLFMTKSQIEAMGGSISVESQPGVGTTFTIHFR
jgi:PAS domain S-box-containing protein